MKGDAAAETSILHMHMFERADWYVANNLTFSSALTMEQRVQLYACRQQKLVGDCDLPKPSFFELVEEVKLRWAAWNALRGTGEAAAIDGFVGAIGAAEPGWETWSGFPPPEADDLTVEQLDKATVKIQAHFRRTVAVKAVKAQQSERAEADERDGAAARLQAVRRGQRDRVRVAEARALVQAQRERQRSAEQIELRAFWHLLLQGFEVRKHKRAGGGGSQPRVLWLDRSGSRLCIAPAKTGAGTPGGAGSLSGTKGLFLRDLSDVRRGFTTAAFSPAPLGKDALCCFSLIGTERSLDLELPSAAAAENIVARFRLLLRALTVHTHKVAAKQQQQQQLPPRPVAVGAAGAQPGAQAGRAGATAVPTPRTATRALLAGAAAGPSAGGQAQAAAGAGGTAVTPAEEAQSIRQLLLQGVELIKYNAKGARTHRVLWLDPGEARLHLGKAKKHGDTRRLKGVSLGDVTEIRPGVNSHGFARAIPDPAAACKCLTIVGGARCFDLQLPSIVSRDFLGHGLRLLLLEHHNKAAGEAGGADDGGGGGGGSAHVDV